MRKHWSMEMSSRVCCYNSEIITCLIQQKHWHPDNFLKVPHIMLQYSSALYVNVFNCENLYVLGVSVVQGKLKLALIEYIAALLRLHCACCTSVCVPLTVIPPAEPAVSSYLPPVAIIVFFQSPTRASPAGWSRPAADAQQTDKCSSSPQEHASCDATCKQNTALVWLIGHHERSSRNILNVAVSISLLIFVPNQKMNPDSQK